MLAHLDASSPRASVPLVIKAAAGVGMAQQLAGFTLYSNETSLLVHRTVTSQSKK